MNTNMPFGINPNMMPNNQIPMMPNNFQSGYDYNLIEQRLQTLERKVQAIEKKLNTTNSTPNNLDYNYNYTSSMHMM
ncbi:MAG TPA: hypothetical protein OIM65_02635 [Bacilli bacterium]|nr:hypothetical protein [Bacilli bacterium]